RLASDQSKAAVPDLQAAMSRDEFDAKTFVHAGYWALEAKQWQLAQAFFQYLTEKDPANPDSFDCLGDYYQAVKDPVNARACYEKALDLDPAFEPSRQKIAKL
ncbi:MAG: tetratricopeptide repeat protein, partial [Acidobacteria bacterium]|nr:tetratricopeptide repeat protein [Acidobacteriota bacterium]